MAEIKINIPFINRSVEIGWKTGEKGWSLFFGGGSRSAAGVNVTEASSMRVSAVYACVRVLSETLASIPLPVYKRLKPRGKERYSDHSVYPILHDLANPEMTSFTWRELMQSHLALWGNSYSEIEYDDMWQVKALWPLRPDRTYPERDPTTSQIRFVTTLADGRHIWLPQERVLHIPGLGFDGLKGYSPISMAREAIGMSLAAEEFGGRFYANGTHIGGVLQSPNPLSDKAYDRLKQDMENFRGGLSNAHRMKILEEGLTFNRIGIPPNEAQFIETRKFQIEEIARIYRVPLHLIQSLDRATNNNIEHQSLEFVMYTMLPWIKRWEQSINWKLFTPSERKKYFAEFLLDALLRGDIKSRYDAYAVARQNGWLSADDIRELENMNPIEGGGGSKYYVPVNMIPADMAEDFWNAKKLQKTGGNA